MGNSAKLDYLVERYIHGAIALGHFFDVVMEGYYPPNHWANQMRKMYELTDSQRVKFDVITSRIESACKIVDYYKNKYGVTQKGMFRDKNRLYKSVFHENPPSSYFAARPFGFAIAFYLPENRFSTDVGGRVSSNRLVIDSVLDGNLANISKGNDPNLDISSIVIHINYRKLRNLKFCSLPNDRNAEKLFNDLFSQEYRELVPRHELRHVIDNLIEGPAVIFDDNPSQISIHGRYDSIYNELSASLFEIESKKIRKRSERELKRDAEREKKYFRRMQDKYAARLKSLRKMQAPSSLIGIVEKSLRHLKEDYDSVFKHINNFPVQLLEELRNRNFYPSALSFLISTTPYTKLPHRLKLIHEYLVKNPIPNKKRFRLDITFAHMYDS